MTTNIHRCGPISRFVVVAIIAAATLATGCSSKKNPAAPVPATININLDYYDYLDLDSGRVEQVSSPAGPAQDSGMDFNIAYNSITTVHGRVFQRTGRGIAHLVGRAYASVAAADVGTTTFTTTLIDQPFASDRTILVKTETGAVYKLGNPVETADSQDGVTFDYAKLKDGL